MGFDRQPLTRSRQRRAMQELAQFGQPDGVSISFANGTYSVLLAAATPGLSTSGGLHVLAHGAGISIDGSGIFLSPFVASGAGHAAGMVPDPGPAAGTTKFLREDASWQVPPGTVSSVGLAASPSIDGLFTVSGSPITSAGTITLTMAKATSTQDGYLGFADFSVFQGKVPGTRTISTTAPLTGGGDLSANRAFALSTAAVFSSLSGSLDFATQAAHLVLIGPASGAAATPTFRALAQSDLPALYALRNRIINGNFDFWQRGTSFTFPAVVGACADRWRIQGIGGGVPTGTISRVTLNPGDLGTTTPASFALQWNQTAVASSGNPSLEQRVENSLTLGGQPFTLSFWGKCSSGTVAVQPLLRQVFQTSPLVDTLLASQTFTTTWQRFTISGTLPSVVGKSVGAGDYLSVQFLMPNGALFTVQYAQVQLEAGTAATDFEFRPQVLELLLCQRYYERSYSLTQAAGTVSSLGPAIAPNTISSLAASTAGNVGEGTFLGFKVEKRAAPTIVFYAFDGSINGCHCENPGAGTSAERNGATAGPVNAAGALQYVTFDATGTFAISKGAILFAHWTAEAEL